MDSENIQILDKISELKGNHEHYFLSGLYNGKNEIAKAFFNYCYNRFTQFELIKEYGNSLKIKNYQIQHTILDVINWESKKVHDRFSLVADV